MTRSEDRITGEGSGHMRMYLPPRRCFREALNVYGVGKYLRSKVGNLHCASSLGGVFLRSEGAPRSRDVVWACSLFEMGRAGPSKGLSRKGNSTRYDYTMIFLKCNRLNRNYSGCVYDREIIYISS